MGIRSLLDYIYKNNLYSYYPIQNQTIIIDGMSFAYWLFHQSPSLFGNYEYSYKICQDFISTFKNPPIIVMDGIPNSMKENTVSKRKTQKNKNLLKLINWITSRSDEKCPLNSITLPPLFVKNMLVCFENNNCKIIGTSEEADQYIQHYSKITSNSNNFICLTDDSDLLICDHKIQIGLLSCMRVKANKITTSVINNEDLLKLFNFTNYEQLLLLASISNSDFNTTNLSLNEISNKINELNFNLINDKQKEIYKHYKEIPIEETSCYKFALSNKHLVRCIDPKYSKKFIEYDENTKYLRRVLVEKITDSDTCCLSDDPLCMIEKAMHFCDIKLYPVVVKRNKHTDYKKYYLLNEEIILKVLNFQKVLVLLIDIYELILNKRIPYSMDKIFDEYQFLENIENEYLKNHKNDVITTNCISIMILKYIQIANASNEKILVILETPFHVRLLADILSVLFSNKFGYKTLNYTKSVFNEKITIIDKNYIIDKSKYSFIIGDIVEGKKCKVISYDTNGDFKCGTELNKDAELVFILQDNYKQKNIETMTLTELISNPMCNIWKNKKNIITFEKEQQHLIYSLTMNKKMYSENCYGVDDLL